MLTEPLVITRGSAPRGELAVDGNYVVWISYEDSQTNVVAYDLRTGEERQLTDDGEPGWDYGSQPESNLSPVTDRLAGVVRPISVLWSPDSSRLICYRLDQRRVNMNSVGDQSKAQPRLRQNSTRQTWFKLQQW